jgi:membrane complex biogenesis BtpA family protein
MNPLLKEMFGVDKPIIAMAHLPAMPGTPHYDAKRDVNGIVESVRRDIGHLLSAGVNAILFCNEDDRPYAFNVGFEAVAVMTRVITEVRPPDLPFGVDFLWDAKAALAVAKATGAAFIREVVTGVYESDMGLWAPDAAELYRYRKMIDAENVRVFANISPEFASPLGTRSIYERARSAAVSSLVDAILIAGPMAGAEPDLSLLVQAKEALNGRTPLVLNTGADVDNIVRFLAYADAAIVGSSLKVDGQTWNPVDPQRTQTFMAKVKQIRVKA